MSYFHDENDSLEQLISDVRLGDNPQHPANPDSVRESAKNELKRRGYTEQEIHKWEWEWECGDNKLL
jgi:hypothetical protein